MPKTCFAFDQIWYWDENFHYDTWFSNFVSEKRKGKKEKEKNWWGWGGRGNTKTRSRVTAEKRGPTPGFNRPWRRAHQTNVWKLCVSLSSRFPFMSWPPNVTPHAHRLIDSPPYHPLLTHASSLIIWEREIYISHYITLHTERERERQGLYLFHFPREWDRERERERERGTKTHHTFEKKTSLVRLKRGVL